MKKSKKVFISYRHVKPDEDLAKFLENYLMERGHEVFGYTQIPAGMKWPDEIQHRLETSDFFVVLLSEESIKSDMVRQEVNIARDLAQRNEKSLIILPISISFSGKLPLDLGAFLYGIQIMEWEEGDPYQIVGEKITATIKRCVELPAKEKSVEVDFSSIDTQVKMEYPIPSSDEKLPPDIAKLGKRDENGIVESESTEKGFIQFLGKFIQIFLIVLALLNFILGTLAAGTVLNSKDFIRTNGLFSFIYIWAVVPMFIAILFTFFLYGSYIVKDDKLLKNYKISTAILAAVLLIIVGYFSYKDSHKTYLTIISEKPIFKVKLESKNNKNNIFDFEPKRIGNSNSYILNGRILFDDYKISVVFKENTEQFIIRKFNTRNETLILF